MRALGCLAALLLLAGCGSSTTGGEPAEPRPPAEVTPSPVVPKPPGDTLDAQPPVDGPLPDTRTGPLPLERCVDDVPGFSFDGTVTAVDGGTATFRVHESFRGDLPPTVEVDLGEPVTAGHSEASPSWSVGTRLLVQGADGVAWGCGDTVYWDEAAAAARRS